MRCKLNRLNFGYAFPFEGNGNMYDRQSDQRQEYNFGYAFPFEGNGNFRDSVTRNSIGSIPFGYAFPFEGNGNSMTLSKSDPSSTLDTLSRLKGMETRSSANLPLILLPAFGYAFPFEGNGNLIMVIVAGSFFIILWIRFPV